MVINDKAFSFPFRDRHWGTKLLIGSLLVLISFVVPIIPLLFALGYVVRGMQFTIRTGENRLPEWDGWAELAANGFLATLIQFLYALPGLVLLTGSGVAYGLHKLLFLAGSDVPAFVAGSAALVLVAIVAFVVGALVLLIGVLLSPMGIARFAATGDLAAALQVGQVWAITRAQLGSFALVWAITFGLSYIAWAVYGLLAYTVCCCWIAPLVSAPLSLYTLIVGMTLFAQTYRAGESATPGAPLLLPDKTNSTRAATVAEEADTAGPATPQPASDDQMGTDSASDKPAQASADSFDLHELDTIGLSGRTQRVLRENGFVTVGQIARALAHSEKELLAIKGFGAKSLEELKTKLEAGGAVLQS